MYKLTSPKVIKDIMSRHGFNFTKSLGQNFLIDSNIVNKIVDHAKIEGENVIEVGPGIGTLTKELLKGAKRVLAIEIDGGLIPILEETLAKADNLKVLHGDILKVDIKSEIDSFFDGESFKLVANLPYYITTPIIMRFLEERLPFTEIIIMIQKELASRLTADPGSKDYGSLTIILQYHTNIRNIMKVPASVFMPRPKVDSSVIGMTRKDASEFETLVHDEELFLKLVKGSFAMRRKTILNNLTSGSFYDMDRNFITNVLSESNIAPITRAEDLDLEAFIKISNNLSSKMET